MFKRKRDDCDRAITRFRDVLVFADRRNKIEDKILSGAGYDRDNFGALEAVLHPGQIAFDIGANIGVYSTVMGQRVGATGTVHAFEPVAHVRGKLLANLRLNGLRNVEVNAIALGAETGSALMNAIRPGEYRAGTSCLLENENMDEIGRDRFETIEVKVTTLDAYVAERSVPRVDVIKMDVEGYELSALKGARKTLAAHRPYILMEHNQARLAKLGIAEGEFAALFDEAGYDCFGFSFEGARLQMKSFAFDRKLKRHNILCTPRER